MSLINCKELHPCNLMPWGMETLGLGESQPAFSKGLECLVPGAGCWGLPLPLGLLTRAATGATAQALGDPVPDLGVGAVLARGTHRI